MRTLITKLGFRENIMCIMFPLLVLIFILIPGANMAQELWLNCDGLPHTVHYSGEPYTQDFRIPYNPEVTKIKFKARGGGGGYSSIEYIVIGVWNTCKSNGGEGALVEATFDVGDGPDKIPYGAYVEFWIGRGGGCYVSYSTVGTWNFGGGGGGGGTSVSFMPYGSLNDELLMVAGGGGGAYQGIISGFCTGGMDGDGGRSGTGGSDGHGALGSEGGGGGACAYHGGGGSYPPDGGLYADTTNGRSARTSNGGWDGHGGYCVQWGCVTGGQGWGGGASGGGAIAGLLYGTAGGGGGYSGGGNAMDASAGGGGSYLNPIGTGTKTAGGTNSYYEDGYVTYQAILSQPPVAVCDADPPALYLDAEGEVTVDPEQLDGGSYDPDGGTVTLSASPSSFNCGDVGSNTVTLRVTDASGHTASCSATVMVYDKIPPSITCPAKKTVNAHPQSCTYSPVFTGGSASDNCGLASVNPSPASVTQGVHTIVWTAADESGNTAKCSQQVTVLDNTAPVVQCQASVTLCAPSDQNYIVIPSHKATITDNCGSGGLDIFYLVSGATSRIGWSSNAGGVFNVGYNIISYSVSDASGNMSTCSCSVTIYKHTTAIAGPDISACAGTPVYVTGNVPTHGTMLWEQLSWPAGAPPATITQAANYASYLINLSAGTHIFRYTITHGSCSSSDEMQVIVGTGPGQANAGPDQAFCGNPGSVVMAATPPAAGSGMWSQMSGPTTASISNLFNPAATLTGLGTGVYVMKWTVSNGSCNPGTDYVTLTLKPAILLNAGPDVAKPVSITSFYVSGSSASNYNSLSWSKTGTGFFNNTTTLHPSYYPSAADKNLGWVKLILTGYQTGCPTLKDTMKLTFLKNMETDPGMAENFTVSVIPNPFMDEADIVFKLPEEGMLSMQVIDMNGRLVELPFRNIQVTASNLTEHIHAGKMADGVYSWFAIFNGSNGQYYRSGRFVIAR